MSRLCVTALLLAAALALLAVTLRARPWSEGACALVVRAQDDDGRALAEVPVWLAGRALGRTDGEGTLRLALAQPAELRAVRLHCPEAYRRARARLGWRGPRHASLRLVCAPKLRTLALVAHAEGGAGRVLSADDQPLGRLDEQGLLHAVLRRPPGARVALSLAARPPALLESAVRRSLLVEDRDRVVLFDPALPPR